MPKKLDDIKGLMIEKKKVPRVNGNSLSEFKENIEGFNEAIDLQGQRQIGLNREKLAKLIFNTRYKVMIWEHPQNQWYVEYCYELADIIITKENELLEVKND